MGENKKYKMKLIVPDGVYCPDKDAEIYMFADVEKIVTQSVLLPVVAENTPDDMTAVLEKVSIPVTLTGPETRLSEAVGVVNLAGLSAGEYQLPVQLGENSEGVTIEDQPTIHVTLQ